jgi:hypothetical protein
MTEESFAGRAHESLRAAIAYELLTMSAECDAEFTFPPALARSIKRIIDEPDYKAIAMDIWHETFVMRNGPLFEAMQQELEGEDVWELLQARLRHRDALPTAGTLPPSRS